MQTTIAQLFRTEYARMVSVLARHFGLAHLETAEDIVSETFLLASETWGLKGLPTNPRAWLYASAKNKCLDMLRRQKTFDTKISSSFVHQTKQTQNTEWQMNAEQIFEDKRIEDSQIRMLFAVCVPSLPQEVQIGLALRILCGFGIDEIAAAFLVSKDTINKRLYRGKEKLRIEGISTDLPTDTELATRLANVLHVLYLLFNDGYYTASVPTKADSGPLKPSLCQEAMRLTILLLSYGPARQPPAFALLALMCFQASRMAARSGPTGAIILYADQDTNLWDSNLIAKGEEFLNLSAHGNRASTYHLQAAIAYWHSRPPATNGKWNEILNLYNRLLILQYSPIVALNRTFALLQAQGPEAALAEAMKLPKSESPFYHTLMAEIWKHSDSKQATAHLGSAIALAKTEPERALLRGRLEALDLVTCNNASM